MSKPKPFDWGPQYEQMIEDCGEYEDDGNRATFPNPPSGEPYTEEDSDD